MEGEFNHGLHRLRLLKIDLELYRLRMRERAELEIMLEAVAHPKLKKPEFIPTSKEPIDPAPEAKFNFDDGAIDV